ncbi:MAG: site-2 protease family protein [Deltaproteobacteria bacterium]|jgi:Zn-dependent protease|nr:site-2 protease family protein [Deltaproteobacteria bacterium]
MLFSRDIGSLLLLIPPLLLALTVHEFSHACVAWLLGDNTAKNEGRLSLNPIRHLDPIGTLMILLSFLIGWAKPVPVNPGNFKHPRLGMSLVAAAGPAANLILVFLTALVFNFVVTGSLLWELPSSFQEPIAKMIYLSFLLNIGLCVFNLLPIPPLDGFNVISGILPRSAVQFIYRYRMVGMLVLILLIFLGFVSKILMPIILFMQGHLLTGRVGF